MYECVRIGEANATHGAMVSMESAVEWCYLSLLSNMACRAQLPAVLARCVLSSSCN